jgi:TetR/AcrR family transcriptional regulator, transcriptional repressor for nem operon
MQKADKKEETRARILASAGRGFRRHGYGGLGVDGLAKDAGVTSGAFYAHFKTKAEAFRAAMVSGMGDLRSGIQTLRGQGPGWRHALIDLYVADRRTGPIDESCALQNLTSEVARGDALLRETFQAELLAVLDATTDDGGDRDEAVALLALLIGGVSISRAVADPALSETIGNAVRKAAEAMIDRPKPKAHR